MDFDDFGGGDNDDFVPEESTLDFFGTEQLSNAPHVQEDAPPSNANATAEILDTLDIEYPPVHVRNMICSVQMKTEVDLREVTIRCRNVEWNPQRVNAAIIRLQKPRVTCMLFAGGKMSICGAKDIKDAQDAAKLATRLVQRTGHQHARCTAFRLESLICSAACGFPVRLENLAKDHHRFCNYEPETFCGLVYRYKTSSELQASVLCFVSGKLIITGCRSLARAEEVFRNLYAVLYQYRM